MRCLLLLLVAACPLFAEEPAGKGPWFGLKVLPKTSKVRIGDWVDGKQLYWEPHNLLNCTVGEDRDGFLRVFDGRREGWVDKDDMVTAADAPAWFDKAMKSQPDVAYNWHMRGHGWLVKGEYENAINDFTEAIRLDPSTSAYYVNRGLAWRNKKDYERAIKDYNEALRLDPKVASAYNNRGMVWYVKKNYVLAMKDYEEALRLDSMYEAPINNQSWLLATCPDGKHRDGKRAVELAKKAVEMTNAADWGNIDTLAAAYAEAGEFPLAVTTQTKANAMYKAGKDVDADVLKKAAARLALYQVKKPYRDEE